MTLIPKKRLNVRSIGGIKGLLTEQHLIGSPSARTQALPFFPFPPGAASERLTLAGVFDTSRFEGPFGFVFEPVTRTNAFQLTTLWDITF